MSSTSSIAARVAQLDWSALGQQLDARGYAMTPQLITVSECAELSDLFADESRFRSRVDMARHRFGVGEYKYFAEPLPAIVATLRQQLYERLVPIANRWMGALKISTRFPSQLTSFLAECAAHGQTRPTPLLLHYTTDGYNCLHQDLYGAVAFPLQATFALSQVGEEYTGGEFLLVEQRPHAQSRGDAIVLRRGEAVIFANRFRPAVGPRGPYRAVVRHGVSRLHSGERLTLGIIFHNAE